MNSRRRLAQGILIAVVLALNAFVPLITAYDAMRPSWLRERWQGVPLSVWTGIVLLALLVVATWIYSRSSTAGGPSTGKQG
ncbi:MAG TPA: hypothetical protein VIH25_02700 [Steroidobacteraceae bacterium]